MEKIELAKNIKFDLLSDEDLLETLIAAATSEGGCEAVEVMTNKLSENFPKETWSFFEPLILNAKKIQALVHNNLLNFCQAEVLRRMKRGRIMA